MNKIYLKDLEKEELKSLIINNNEFMEKYANRLYEDYMDMQLEESNLMLGTDFHKYIDIRDNYNSFYLVLKDWSKFIDNVDHHYLSDKGIELYNYIVARKDDLYSMADYDEDYMELEEHLEEKSKELLSICEDLLHEWEKYPSEEDIYNYIIDNYSDDLEDLYTDENKKTIYKDISYTKEWK